MQKISLMEFEEFCKNNKVEKFIYDTDNQNEDSITRSIIHIISEFNSAKVFYNPNTLFLESGKNYMKLGRINYIEYRGKSILGCVFSVICGDTYDNSMNSFTIICQ